MDHLTIRADYKITLRDRPVLQDRRRSADVLDDLAVEPNVNAELPRPLVESLVKVGAVDNIVRRIIVLRKLRVKFRQPDNTTVLPPPELDAVGPDCLRLQVLEDAPPPEEPS